MERSEVTGKKRKKAGRRFRKGEERKERHGKKRVEKREKEKGMYGRSNYLFSSCRNVRRKKARDIIPTSQWGN